MSNVLSSTDQLTVYVQPKPFTILRPERTPARGIGLIVDPSCWDDAMTVVLSCECPIALDFETRGTDPTLPDNYIVGMGLASEGFNYYFHRLHNPAEFDALLHRLLESQIPLIAHNAYFDGQWIFNDWGSHANWEACTYALYRKLATEGWTGQRWGLKEAMQDVLLWDNANDDGISEWLVQNGYVNQSGNPLKGEMWRCPPEILGQYCLLDAEATYLLYTRILRPALEKFPELAKFHRTDFINLIKVLIEQKQHGIEVDREGLIRARSEIEAELGPMEAWIRTESDIAPHVRQWEENKLAQFDERQPERYRKPTKLGVEPLIHKKDGTVSKTWLKWIEKRDRAPVESKNWLKWQSDRMSIVNGESPRHRFNLRSGDHLRWLFFDAMGMEAVEFTKGGIPKCDTDTMRAFGPGGEALERFHLLHKELSFVTAYLTLTESRVTVHPGFRVPGTLTGRLSGTEPNIQQVPKSRRFLQCLRARPGHVWIDADFTALEPVVATELSGDPELMKVFGPDAPKGSDIYLHTGAGLPQFRDQIVAAGYDPDNLTAEGAADAKKSCKAIRGICKVVYLSSQYGAGPGKIWRTLRSQGVEIDLEQVRELHRQYWEYYSGIKRWEKQLRLEHRENHGWVMNGIGRPIGVHQDSDRMRDKRKDIVNRVVQSTGHDILVRYLRILTTLFSQRDISWVPIIVDFHDEVLIEVPEGEVKLAMTAFRDANSELNLQLGGSIPLRINPVVVRTLADAKLED